MRTLIFKALNLGSEYAAQADTDEAMEDLSDSQHRNLGRNVVDGSKYKMWKPTCSQIMKRFYQTPT